MCAQVSVLEVLAQEGALHLLPSGARAPGGRSAYSGHQRPDALQKLLVRLNEEGFLKKAEEMSSMVTDLVPVESMKSGV